MNELTVLTGDGALGIDLREMTVAIDLAERLKKINMDQIAASDRRFARVPKKSKVLGTIDEMGTRALHALWMSLDAEASLEAAKASMAAHEEVETDHRERHALLETLAGVAREMWWAQVKLDLAMHKCVGIGVFKNWTIVERKSGSSPMDGLMGMFGRMPMPGMDSGDDE